MSTYIRWVYGSVKQYGLLYKTEKDSLTGKVTERFLVISCLKKTVYSPLITGWRFVTNLHQAFTCFETFLYSTYKKVWIHKKKFKTISDNSKFSSASLPSPKHSRTPWFCHFQHIWKAVMLFLCNSLVLNLKAYRVCLYLVSAKSFFLSLHW